MAAIALSGNDSVSINNSVLADLADGDCVTLEFPNEIATVKIGKNGNAIYGQNQTGNMAEVKIRVIRGSADDKFLNNLELQQNTGNNFPSTVLMIGEFIKIMGDGQGNITHDIYIMAGGVFHKLNAAKSNVEGDATQSVTEYMIRFASAVRALT
jgi:hypothetical protein